MATSGGVCGGGGCISSGSSRPSSPHSLRSWRRRSARDAPERCDGTTDYRAEAVRSRANFRTAWCRWMSETPWTHAVDHSFKRCFGVRSKRIALQWYQRLTYMLPRHIRPTEVLMVAEEHPVSPGWFHLHGMWVVPAALLYDGWWRTVKEYFWEHIGKTYCRPLPVEHAPRWERLMYCLKHASKWLRKRPRREPKADGITPKGSRKWDYDRWEVPTLKYCLWLREYARSIR